ncbi:preQ(1) synthase [Deltaproteobacteria bacterium TL4]
MDVTSTEYAEGRIYAFESEASIDVTVLKTFPYEGSKQKVSYKTNEFSAVCPFSGLPDFGTVWIKYIPKTQIVELKSLKYYLLSFRSVGIFQEAVTSLIFKDLWALMKPETLVIKTRYKTRGGIDTTCLVRSKDQTLKE